MQIILSKLLGKKYLLPAAGLLWLLSGFSSAIAEDTSIHHVPSDTCKQCHKEIFKQWKGSMHAQSSALKDPIHGGFYKQVVGDPTKEGITLGKGKKYPICLQCHTPNAAKDKSTKLDAKPLKEQRVKMASKNWV